MPNYSHPHRKSPAEDTSAAPQDAALIPDAPALQQNLEAGNDNQATTDADKISHAGELLADQAAGMVMQDVETFSQGFMQMMTAGIGIAVAEIAATDGAKGTTALEDLQTALMKLPTFITSMSGAAKSMENMESSPTLSTVGGTPSDTNNSAPNPTRDSFFSRFRK